MEGIKYFHSSLEEMILKEIVIKYYAPWCIYSSSLANSFKNAAASAKNSNLPVAFLEINVDSEKEFV